MIANEVLAAAVAILWVLGFIPTIGFFKALPRLDTPPFRALVVLVVFWPIIAFGAFAVEMFARLVAWHRRIAGDSLAPAIAVAVAAWTVAIFWIVRWFSP